MTTRESSQFDEHLLHSASCSWWLLAPELGSAALSLPVAIAALVHGRTLAYAVSAIFSLVFIHGILSAARRRLSLKVQVTNRRLIVRRGLVRMHSSEVNLNRIESIDTDQGILGRTFDFGDATVRGVGSEDIRLYGLERPLLFKAKVFAALDEQSRVSAGSQGHSPGDSF